MKLTIDTAAKVVKIHGYAKLGDVYDFMQKVDASDYLDYLILGEQDDVVPKLDVPYDNNHVTFPDQTDQPYAPPYTVTC